MVNSVKSGAGVTCIAPDFTEKLEEGSFPPQTLLRSNPRKDPNIVAVAVHLGYDFEIFCLKVNKYGKR